MGGDKILRNKGLYWLDYLCTSVTELAINRTTSNPIKQIRTQSNEFERNRTKSNHTQNFGFDCDSIAFDNQIAIIRLRSIVFDWFNCDFCSISFDWHRLVIYLAKNCHGRKWAFLSRTEWLHSPIMSWLLLFFKPLINYHIYYHWPEIAQR